MSLSEPTIPALARKVVQGCATDVEKANAIRQYIASNIRHDYDRPDPLEIDPEETLKRRTGKCGQRAALFQAFALSVGLKSRIVIYRGHVQNEVLSHDEWVPFDTTVPLHEGHIRHLELIRAGPVIGYADTPYCRTQYEATPIVFGQYSRWLKSLKDRVANILLPNQILTGECDLADNRPNVIIRHDIDSEPERILPMLHEENMLGMRSVTYVRVDGETYNYKKYVDMLRMFEHEGFEFGLHITAINRDGMSMKEALARFEEQEEEADRVFTVWTVQGHDYDNERGEIPKIRNFDLEDLREYGFSNLLERTGRFQWRIADSIGVMCPGDPLEWIPKMKIGKLYYCLWHPEYYLMEKGWVSYQGTFAQSFRESALEAVLSHIPRMRSIQPILPRSEVRDAANYLARHVKNGETILDGTRGCGMIGLFLHEKIRNCFWHRKQVNYVWLASNYEAFKAAEALYQTFRLQDWPTLTCTVPADPDWSIHLDSQGKIVVSKKRS